MGAAAASFCCNLSAVPRWWCCKAPLSVSRRRLKPPPARAQVSPARSSVAPTSVPDSSYTQRATQTSVESHLSAQTSQHVDPSPAIRSHGEAISSFLASGVVEFNETSFDAWVDVAKAPALPSSLKLYNELQGLGFHIILLTGRSESQRNATEENLLFAGYHSWEKLILRQPSDIGKTAVQYKSERRAVMEVEGFKILGNSGDQWSDLIGLPVSTRSFKLPNPMYYIS